MRIEKKDTHILLTPEEDSFEDSHHSFSKETDILMKAHIIIQLSDNLNTDEKEICLFLDIATEKKKNSTSFIVVATGIDASAVELETPIPRRTLKAPLPLREEDIQREEVAEEDVSEPEVEVVPVLEVEVAATAQAGEELSMFDVPEFDQTATEPVKSEPAEVVAEMPVAPAQDDLPEPMYQHQEEAENIEHLPDPIEAVEPSEATYRRLQQAVEKEPMVDPRESLRPALQPEEPKRGVLGGFISRMTGGQAEDGYHDEDSARAEPSFQDEVEQMSPSDDQVEVPAFLRRQAN